MKLKLADDLYLPIDVVTEKLAFLGRTGSGKTYAAMKLAELMLEAGAQIVSLDPVGVWYGLRIGSKWNVYIFGGLHGDFPLNPTSGGLMADLIVDRGICAVLDVSQFIRSEQIRFANDFIVRFYDRKKSAPAAVHIFIEESQEFIPQNVMGEEARMLHNFERAWKIGRNFGIGGSLISQRPQELNKKALNQAGTLFTFQMTGPQERKAVESWVSDKGISEDIGALLPRLQVGQPHVWSPTFLNVSKTVRILPKQSADVSTTPKVGTRTQERPLTPIDKEKLEVAMAETKEKAKADDPKELHRQISELQRKIREWETRKPEAVKVETKEVSVLTEDDRKLLASAEGSMEFFETYARDVKDLLRTVLDKTRTPQHLPRPQLQPNLAKPLQNIPKILPPRSVNQSQNGNLSGPEHRIIDAIAWLESIGVDSPEQPAVAFLAGYTYGGGGFNNPKGKLRSKSLVEYVPGDKIRLTEEGRNSATVPDESLTTEELHRAVLDRLPGPEQKILTVILRHYPNAITNDQCADEAGYTVGAGGYNNPRGRLRTLGLIEYPEGGKVRARDILFL